jgi:hypothetical protein
MAGIMLATLRCDKPHIRSCGPWDGSGQDSVCSPGSSAVAAALVALA